MKNSIFIFISAAILCLWHPAKAGSPADSLLRLAAASSNPAEQFDAYYNAGRLGTTDAEALKLYLEKCRQLNAVINTEESNAKLAFLTALLAYKEESNTNAAALFQEASRLLEKSRLRSELADCYSYHASMLIELGDYAKAIELFERSSEIAKELNNKLLICENGILLGKAYSNLGNTSRAVEYLQASLKLAEELKSKKFTAQATLIMGAVYSEGVNQDYADKYLAQSAKLSEEMKDTAMLINVYTYLANNHYYQKRYREALSMYEKVKVFCITHGTRNLYAGTLGNMGNVYADMGDIEKALPLQFEAARIFEEIGDTQGMVICYSAIAIDYLNLKEYGKSLEYFNKSLPLAQQMGSTPDLIEIHSYLARLYEEQKDYKKAYENYKLFKQYNDSIYNDDNARKLTELEMNYQFESRQKEAELLQELTNERFKRVIVMAVAGILLLLVILFIIYRSNRQKKKANRQLASFNTEILRQKREIEEKSTIIEVAYNDIKSSINYAKRIQEAILPVREEIKKAFPDSFVLFRPRDVVSGDFYWYTQRGSKKIIACVDCTGHGVPGAFMSMIGNTLLNEIINEKGIEQPAAILDLLHERVRQSLKQDLAVNETRDGMDMLICVIEEESAVMQYAGANRPLYIIRDNELREIRPDKLPIGGDKMEEDRRFTNHIIEVKANDRIYMSSDGYADQFGGDKGKKFMVKKFHQLLLEIHQLPMEMQGQKLEKMITDWQGNLEQVDDILVMGIRL